MIWKSGTRYFANFGDLIYHGRDVLTPFWIDTGLPVPGTDRALLVPVSHSQHEFIVRGSVVNADLSFYFGIDGEAVFRPSVTRDQAWVMGKVAHRYRSAEALEVTRLAGGIVRAYTAIKQRHPELPFGGYYALGLQRRQRHDRVEDARRDVLVPLDARPTVLQVAAKSINSPSACRWITGGMRNRTHGAFWDRSRSMSRRFHCPP